MKPEDLLDAIQGIPEDYIAEAKPKRHRDPRRSLHSAEQSAAASSAENIRESSGSPASGAVQHTPKHRREEPDMTQKHFSLHRLTTGIAAAAACAVFIGGGVFIAKQAADRDRSDGGTDGQITNFLGGKGEIHVAYSSSYPRRTLDLMYDDTRVYFDNGKYAADRTGSGVLKAYPTSEDVQMTLSNTFWDGERFYYAYAKELYPMDMTGSRSAEPFYEIEWEPAEDSPIEIDHIQFSDVVKLRENDYWISFRMHNADESGEYAGSVWHHTGEDSKNYSDGTGSGRPGMILPDHPELSVWQTAANVLSCRTQNPDGTVSGSPLNMGPGSRNEMEYGTAWTLRGEDVYYMTEIYADNIQFPHSSYAKINVLTEAYTEVCEKPEFDSFIPVGDSMLTVSRDGKALSASDFELTKTDVLFEYGDSVPAEIRDTVSDAWNAAPLKSLAAADEQYALTVLDTKADAPQSYALFDRATNEMRYYQVSVQPAPEEQQPVPDAEHNFLGGIGEVHANDSQMYLLYDDTRYYFAGGTLCADRSGGQLGRVTESGFRHEGLQKYCTDGECFYQQDGIHLYRTDNYGRPEETPFFTLGEDDLENARSRFSDSGSIEEKVHAFTVQKLCEGYYVVTAYLSDFEAADSRGITVTFSYLYHPETGTLTAMPKDSVPRTVWYSPEEKALYTAANVNGEMYRIALDDSGKTGSIIRQTTRIPMLSHGLEYGTRAAIDGGWFYYFSRVVRDGIQDEALSYVRMNLDTHAYEDIPLKADFCDNVIADGAVWSLTSDGSQLWQSDMQMQASSILWTLDKDAPENVRSRTVEGNENCPPGIYSISPKYAAVMLRGPEEQLMLLELSNGSIRYFSQHYTDDELGAASPVQQDTAPAAPQENGHNLFGGSGALRPVDWNPNGETSLFRDNDYYYMQTDSGTWHRWKIGEFTTEAEEVTPMLNTAPYTGRLISDGERIYTETLDIVTGAGTGAFCLDVRDAIYQDTVIPDSQDGSFRCKAVWHIRNDASDTYFMVFSLTDGVNGAAENICTIWCDRNGKVLEAKHLTQEDAIGAFFSDAQCRRICRYRADTIEYVPMPGEADTGDGGSEPVQTAEEQNGELTAAAISDGMTVFLRTKGDRQELVCVRPHGDYTVVDEQPAGFLHLPLIAPDGTVWYVRQLDETTWKIAVYDPVSGETHTYFGLLRRLPIHFGIAAEDEDYQVLIYMDENYEFCPSFLIPDGILNT